MKRLLFISLYALLMSCVGENNISREYECYFVFDTSLHPLPCQLTGILGNPGHFAKVESSMVQGVRHLKTTRNYDNATEDIMLRSEKESKTVCELGANNCIIVGVSSFNGLVAYDGQCANCLKELGGTNFPLTWQNNGTQLHCAKCGRTYDANNGTVASGTPGRQLLNYRAVFNGTILSVSN